MNNDTENTTLKRRTRSDKTAKEGLDAGIVDGEIRVKV
jgi:hypothetical protein